MSLIGLFAVDCDRCGVQGPAAANPGAARTVSTGAGWAVVRDAVRVFDYCPAHAGGPTPVPVVYPPPPSWVCPECGQGKHGNCNGWAWDFDADEKTQCQCPEVHP